MSNLSNSPKMSKISKFGKYLPFMLSFASFFPKTQQTTTVSFPWDFTSPSTRYTGSLAYSASSSDVIISVEVDDTTTAAYEYYSMLNNYIGTLSSHHDLTDFTYEATHTGADTTYYNVTGVVNTAGWVGIPHSQAFNSCRF